ncbi:MAG TPA: hypothetical protein VFA12_04945 [Stellaceae bacterium]|nr:hypothetical protein [Stellaceae bacterium]
MEVGAPVPVRPLAGNGVTASPALPNGQPQTPNDPRDGIAIEIIEGVLLAGAATRERVSLRLLPPLPLGMEDEAATAHVIAGANGPRLATGLGTIVPQRPLAALIGSVIRFEFLSRNPLAPQATPPPPHAPPQPAAPPPTLLNPAELPRLTAALLLLAAAPTGLVRVRDAIVERLRAAPAKLNPMELDALTHGGWQIAEPGGDMLWRVLPFPWPLPDYGQAHVLRRERPGAAAGAAEEPVRFMLEVPFRRFGIVQLDGLYRHERFDVVLRSHSPFAPEIRSAAAQAFAERLSAGGLGGRLSFSVTARFPVTAAPAPKALGLEV